MTNAPAVLLWFCICHASAQTVETLTLPAALQLALSQNRGLRQAQLEPQRLAAEYEAVRTRRLPQFRFSLLGGILLTRPSIEFERGVFGEYPGTGPIPDRDTRVEAERKPAFLIFGQAAQPLSQQYRIGLQLKQVQLEQAVTDQQIRETRQAVAHEVRRTYYAMLEAQSALQSLDAQAGFLAELEKTTATHVEQKTVLKTDLLKVQAQRASLEAERASLTGSLDSAREKLNLLLARPVTTAFRVSTAPDALMDTVDPQALAERAVSLRTDVKRSEIREQQADLNYRIKRSELIPDVSATVNYFSFTNIRVLPRNIASAGVQLEWEPFDWGRKRREMAARDVQRQQARLQTEEMRDRVRVEVAQLARKLSEAQRRLEAARKAQEESGESLRLTQARYNEQAALLKDVLQAQAAVASADDQHRRALLAFYAAQADLSRAMGEDL